MEIKLTLPAIADLASIEEYTMRQWGEAQANMYLAQIEKRILSLSDTPYLGTARPDILENCRGLPEGKHIILYRVEDELINILGVPHASMKLERHLEQKTEQVRDDDLEQRR